MSTTLDIEELVMPISEDSATGEDLRADVRFDSPYQALKNLREEAMAVERAIQQGSGEQAADYSSARGRWLDVVRAAEAILRDTSKDLEVSALLIEGLVRTDGVAGVRDGFRLALALVRSFWDELHPRLDPDDPDSLDDRLAAFNGLDGGAQPGTLARYIPQLRVTDCGAEDYYAYQLEQAFNQRGAAEGSNATQLGFGVQDIQSAAAKTSLQFYLDLVEALDGAEAARAELDQVFTDICGFDAPSTGRTREALDKLSGYVRYLAGDRLDAAPSAAESEDTQEHQSSPEDEGYENAAAGSAGRPGAAPSGAIQNRDDAINRLRKVAAWFREHEPHSPLSYSLDNLVRWANMPLHQLIAEWIQDDSALERYRLMTGMQARDADED